jgi:hypothetical protein
MKLSLRAKSYKRKVSSGGQNEGFKLSILRLAKFSLINPFGSH